MSSAAPSSPRQDTAAGIPQHTPLRGEHLAALHAALLQAFDLNSLEHMVKLGLDRDLATLVPLRDHNLSEVAYRLVRWAAGDPQIGVKGLLAAAWETNPGNSALAELHAAWALLLFDVRPGCPYPGMQPFTQRQSQHFFGREAEVAEALQRLRLHPFLIVIGASGSGKSSLAFAGIVPAMQRSSFFGGERLRICSFRPGAAPLAALAAALGCAAPEAAGPAELVACAEQRTRTAPALLLVDQFEETYTLAPPALGSEQGETQAELFQQTLLRLAGLPNLYLLLTARADFYANLMNSPLWPLIQAHRLEIMTLGEEALRAAITLPAQAVGVTVQEGLVERLVADAAGEPGALPFLQETLVLLWDKLQHAELPLAAYAQLASGQSGRTGLQVAMALRADAALADPRLPAGGQAIARRIFLRLVQFGEGRPNTRRQQAEGDLRAAGEDPAAFDAVLSLLIACRLLSASGDSQGAERRIDIAHEALLGGWPALAAWVGERRQAEVERRRLEGKAAEWVRLGRSDAGLLDRVELKEAAAYLDGLDGADLGASEDLLALAAASRKAVDPGWNGRGVLGLAGGALAVLALLAAGLFYLQTNFVALAARVALLLFWAALAVALIVLLWLLRRSDPQILKRWSQNVPLNRMWQAGVGLTAVAACLSWLAIGVWALPVEQKCRAAGLSREQGIDQIAVINDNADRAIATIFAQAIERASTPLAEAQLLGADVALDCASFLAHIVVIGIISPSDSDQSYYAAELDPRSGERRHLALGYTADQGCRGLLYMATDIAGQFQYISPSLDPVLLNSGNPPCAAVLANEQGLATLSHDIEKARRHFLDALTLDPFYVDPIVNWGAIYSKTGEWDKAIEQFRLAQEFLPEPSQLVLHHLAYACYNAGDMACAADAYEQSLKLTTDIYLRLSRLNNLFQVYRQTQAWTLAAAVLQEYTNLLKTLDDPPQEYAVMGARNQGILAFGQQQWDEAARFFMDAARWQEFRWQDWLDVVRARLVGRDIYAAKWRSYHVWDEEIVYYLAVTAELREETAAACEYWLRYQQTPNTDIFGQAQRREEGAQRAKALHCSEG